MRALSPPPRRAARGRVGNTTAVAVPGGTQSGSSSRSGAYFRTVFSSGALFAHAGAPRRFRFLFLIIIISFPTIFPLAHIVSRRVLLTHTRAHTLLISLSFSLYFSPKLFTVLSVNPRKKINFFGFFHVPTCTSVYIIFFFPSRNPSSSSSLHTFEIRVERQK